MSQPLATIAVPRPGRRATLGLLTAAAVAALSGCGGPDLPPAPAAEGPARLTPGDKVSIAVFGQTQLTREDVIADDGTLALPLGGRVMVAGLTVAEAQAAIRARLGMGILVKPEVALSVLKYRPVFVLGEVAKPGAVDWISDLRVINAVSLAGGYTYRARTDTFALIRGDDPSRRRYLATDETRLQPGDTVEVQERWF
jgi:polysaccharide export outer membrane protein